MVWVVILLWAQFNSYEVGSMRFIFYSCLFLLVVASVRSFSFGGLLACTSTSDLDQCLSTLSSFQHLTALQEISDRNGGNRAAETQGLADSFQYVENILKTYNLEISKSPVPITDYHTDHAFSIQNDPQTFKLDKDFFIPASGENVKVTGEMIPINVQLGMGNSSASGCRMEDFRNFPSGKIALIQAGTCDRLKKFDNAVAAGAVAVVFFNQGDTAVNMPPAEYVPVYSGYPIPVVSVSYQVGQSIVRGQRSPIATIEINFHTTTHNVFNLIAETKSGDENNVIVVGAHLDSVEEGPGINDNGSGAAALIEVAKLVSQMNVKNKVRFIWWTHEELWLVGSRAYMNGLSEQERKRISVFLNFDMIASPNYILGIYYANALDNQDNDITNARAQKIGETFEKFYQKHGRNFVRIPTNSVGSDHLIFEGYGIASGGLFSGGNKNKTEQEAELFGGTANQEYDSCHHQSCDDIRNISRDALDLNTQAAGYATIMFANETGF
jgi:Zn-dependent M28 family amino/carboxypeptidase